MILAAKEEGKAMVPRLVKIIKLTIPVFYHSLADPFSSPRRAARSLIRLITPKIHGEYGE